MRIIARLDTKPPYLIKPIQFEGLRKLGFSKEYAYDYYKNGADEIFYCDVVASLFDNDINFQEIESISKGLLIPLSVGGGVKTIDQFIKLIQNGVDKVVLNTYAFKNPDLINMASSKSGSQSVVIHIEAKKVGSKYECFTDCGRIPTGREVLDWAKEVQSRGAGEIVISSIDKDGMKQGFDINLIKLLTSNLKIPIVAASGAGSKENILKMIQETNPDAVALGSILHYKISNINEIKKYLYENGINVTYEE